jgi:hypothetical protein
MIKDTSSDYEHMLGYISEENINKGSLSDFLELEIEEYRPEVKTKKKDPEFPEEWQSLLVSFRNEKDYARFMQMIDHTPSPKLQSLIYERPGNQNNIFNFIGGE